MLTALDIPFFGFLFIRDLSYLKRDPFPFLVDKPLDEFMKEAIQAWALEQFFGALRRGLSV